MQPHLVVFSGEDGELRLSPDLVVGVGMEQTRVAMFLEKVSEPPARLVLHRNPDLSLQRNPKYAAAT
ncbi:hypothetical protein L1987_54416 [Smallanthus sonchifolius]|uniref:Uncharacterized protein n=1 Tax=Smallanthus sonchifolius TaxID=185202 RepID=A0ACB9E6M8_9ASTR|nr:hypothetical protein L1987_54416 [Smallanthus sonchifolius]